MGTFTTLLFHPYQQKINTYYHIDQVCCGPVITKNFRTDRGIIYFQWYTAIQIGHVIDMKRKDIPFMKQLSGKFHIMGF